MRKTYLVSPETHRGQRGRPLPPGTRAREIILFKVWDGARAVLLRLLMVANVARWGPPLEPSASLLVARACHCWCSVPLSNGSDPLTDNSTNLADTVPDPFQSEDATTLHLKHSPIERQEKGKIRL